MRQTIGGTWVFQLVIIFTLIFAAYIALTINYSKSFRVKNEVLSIIEKSQGMTEDGIKLINNYLNQSGYNTTGKCTISLDAKTYGVKSLSTDSLNGVVEEVSDSNQEYYYCFTKFGGYHTYYKSRAYYKINLFFRFDLPVIGRIGFFTVDGQTSEIDATYDKDTLESFS